MHSTPVDQAVQHGALYLFFAILLYMLDLQLGLYRHAKSGKMYRVISLAKHSETQEDMVVYEALYENSKSQIWVRPLAIFQEKITIDGKPFPRFVLIEVKKPVA